MVRILQIVPQLPPAICGVGDYALQLARLLKSQHGMLSEFLVGNATWYSQINEVEGFPIHRLSSNQALALRTLITQQQFDAILLHYSGYGFHNRGIPFWLAYGLTNTIPLLTMFHELFATSYPWRSAFWLSPWMRNLARRIAKSSNIVVTNRQAGAEWLGNSKVLPISSNFGDPEPEQLTEKMNWLAYFGHQYDLHPQYEQKLLNIVKVLKPDKLISIGRSHPNLQRNFEDGRVVALGNCSTQEASSWLSKCKYGYLCYFPDSMGKSSILGAYAAHKLCVFFCGKSHLLSDGLEIDKQLLACEEFSPSGHDEIAERLYDWYRPHSVAASAAFFAEQLKSIAIQNR